MNFLKIATTIVATFIAVVSINAQQKQDSIISSISDTSVVVVETVVVDNAIDTTIIPPITSSASTNKLEFSMLVKDSQVLVTLDKLLYEKFYKKNFFNVDTSGISQSHFAVDEIPTYPDSIYEQRIAALNIETPIELTYNKEVKSFINLYAVKKKDLTARMLGLAEIYFPLFEESLDKYDDLYDIYGDWSLALAAYNSGAGNVNRAIRRAGGTKNYWAVWPFLPRETRGYVPAFIAVNYVMNYAPEHNIYPMRPSMFYYDIDTVTINDILSFDQLNEMLGIPMDELKFMNPQFKKEIIPATAGKKYTIRIPRMYYVNQIKRWNNLKNNTIYPGQKLVLFGAGSNKYYQKTATPVMRSSEKTTHIVKNGENLGLIAKKYSCTVTDLKEWNNMGNSKIFPKQKLVVYKPESKSSSSVKEGKYLYHVVRKGDTLWDIAKEYDGITVDKIKSLNNFKNSNRLKPGQKIKISVIS